MVWTFGTMTDEERVLQEATAEAAQEELRPFFRQMLEIDERARNTPGVGVVIPASGKPRFTELGLAIEEAAGRAPGAHRGLPRQRDGWFDEAYAGESWDEEY